MANFFRNGAFVMQLFHLLVLFCSFCHPPNIAFWGQQSSFFRPSQYFNEGEKGSCLLLFLILSVSVARFPGLSHEVVQLDDLLFLQFL